MVYGNKFNKNSDLSMTYFGTDKNDEKHLRSKQRKDILSLVKGLFQENYGVAQNVKFC